MQMLDYGPRDGKAVVGRGPTTHLVEDDQRASGALGKDISPRENIASSTRLKARQ
jgi:hypothetical protein